MRLFGTDQSRREFEEFVDRGLPRLHRMALSLTGQQADAEDLVQEALAKTYLHWGKVAASGSPGAYVRAILANSFMSSRRRRSADEVVSTEVVDRKIRSIDSTAAFIERHDLLSAVLLLPPDQRVVIVLRYLEDLSVPEVARLLGKREGAVRAACHRGLEKLRANARGAGEATADGRAAHASA